MPILYQQSNYIEFFMKYSLPEILIVDVRLNENEYEKIFTIPHYKPLLVITEPIYWFGTVGSSCKYSYKAFVENKFTYLLGCINHDPKNGRYKYPLYMFIPSFDFKNKQYFMQINDFVKNTNMSQLNDKKFNILINKWDVKTRTCIYDHLKTIGHIDCPGKLFNNCSNEEMNRVGKVKYLQNYKFNICSENFDTKNVPGYITEKLMECCLGGAIPVYAGWFDEYDERILNKNRIIFYNSDDKQSIEYAYYKVKFLMENPEMLLSFYNQPVFCETAYDTIQELCNDCDRLLSSK
jgi:hypothetical protein